MKFIHLSFILILITFQSCTSSSNSQLATLINDIITEKETFIEKSIPNMTELTEELTTNNIDANYARLIENSDFLWNKVEIINDGKSIFVNSNDYKYDDSLHTFLYQFIINYNEKTTFRYHSVNTIFDTTISVKKGDIIKPPYGIYNHYDIIFDYSSFPHSDDEAKEKMIPSNLLKPSTLDTTFLIVANTGCFHHTIDYYKFYKERDSVIFKKYYQLKSYDDEFQTSKISTLSVSNFEKIIQKFRKGATTKSNLVSTSNMKLFLIKKKKTCQFSDFRRSMAAFR